MAAKIFSCMQVLFITEGELPKLKCQEKKNQLEYLKVSHYLNFGAFSWIQWAILSYVSQKLGTCISRTRSMCRWNDLLGFDTGDLGDVPVLRKSYQSMQWKGCEETEEKRETAKEEWFGGWALCQNHSLLPHTDQASTGFVEGQFCILKLHIL